MYVPNVTLPNKITRRAPPSRRTNDMPQIDNKKIPLIFVISTSTFIYDTRILLFVIFRFK